MLTIEKTVLMSPEQMEMVIEGMRNPKNSWNKSDSAIEYIENPETMNTAAWQFHLGDADYTLMKALTLGGAVHAKYRRMMPVMSTINAPLYWWKEFDTYKIGTVANSCSTMHKIHAKSFEMSDFSTDHLFDKKDVKWGDPCSISVMELIIEALNTYRNKYIETGSKEYWWQMIQLLPSSYNQKRTVMLNYEVLSNIYNDRRSHKLDEWHAICDWIEKLPYSDIIFYNAPNTDESYETKGVCSIDIDLTKMGVNENGKG